EERSGLGGGGVDGWRRVSESRGSACLLVMRAYRWLSSGVSGAPGEGAGGRGVRHRDACCRYRWKALRNSSGYSRGGLVRFEDAEESSVPHLATPHLACLRPSHTPTHTAR